MSTFRAPSRTALAGERSALALSVGPLRSATRRLSSRAAALLAAALPVGPLRSATRRLSSGATALLAAALPVGPLRSTTRRLSSGAAALLAAALVAALPARGEVVLNVEDTPRAHQLYVYGRSGLSLMLTRRRSMGGVGPGFGVGDLIKDRFLVQADVSYLFLLGNALEVRLSGGVQRSGTWAPAALANFSLLFGQHLVFSEDNVPISSNPGVSFGLTAAPLRFRSGSATVSFLEVGLALATDPGFPALQYRLAFMELAIAL